MLNTVQILLAARFDSRYIQTNITSYVSPIATKFVPAPRQPASATPPGTEQLPCVCVCTGASGRGWLASGQARRPSSRDVLFCSGGGIQEQSACARQGAPRTLPLSTSLPNSGAMDQ